jgi:hypothetical protein
MPTIGVVSSTGSASGITFVVQEIYQQPDDETLLRVVTGGAGLRSARYAEPAKAAHLDRR